MQEQTQEQKNEIDKSNNGWLWLHVRLIPVLIVFIIMNIYLGAEYIPTIKYQTKFGHMLQRTSDSAALFIFPHLLVSAIMLVQNKLFSKRKVRITVTLCRAIIPAFILGCFLISGGRYNQNKHNEASASPVVLTDKHRRDLYDGIKRSCVNSQKSDPLHKSISESQIEEYCSCCAGAISSRITVEEINFFIAKGIWPDGYETKVREEGFKCGEQMKGKLYRN